MSNPASEKRDPRVKTRIRTTQAVVVAAVFALLFVAPFWGRHHLVTEIMRWTGYLALIVGVMGRVWCSAYIGGRKSQLIIDVGPYSTTRNPLYVFSFIALVGVGLVSGMLSVTLLFAIYFVLYYRGVVAGEEMYLTRLHEEAFGDYRARVPRWIPNLRLYREGGEPMGLPRNILITILETSAFFLAWPLFALVAYLQDSGILPVLLLLP